MYRLARRSIGVACLILQVLLRGETDVPNPSGSLTRRLSVGLFLFVPGLVLAGPNEGGTLVIHANRSLVFTSDIQDYCGISALDSCSAAVTSVEWDPGKKIVFHVLAAFPPESSPRLKVLSFGIDYDPTKFVIAARQTCAGFEISDGRWPAPAPASPGPLARRPACSRNATGSPDMHTRSRNRTRLPSR